MVLVLLTVSLIPCAFSLTGISTWLFDSVHRGLIGSRSHPEIFPQGFEDFPSTLVICGDHTLHVVF